MDIILASGSPRRRELLERFGLPFTVRPADIEERVAPGLTPDQIVLSLSQQKAEAVAGQFPGALVLAADTVVAYDRTVLGKPADAADAARMLRLLSGKTHQVYTGFTLQLAGRRESAVECTSVSFRELTEGEIAAYVASGEPLDKAGAYGIQGLGGLLVTGIRGDYYNVMGLPVCRLGVAFKEFGIDLLGKG